MPPNSADPPSFRLGHRRWLDGLRGVAILMVLAYHTGLWLGGFLGVDLFFVLSGFLITCLLVDEWQKTGRIHLRRFYLRRALRLLPALFFLFFLLVVAALLGLTPLSKLFREILVTSLYCSNWQSSFTWPMLRLGHTWSLSIEEQFYLLWPLILLGLLCARLSKRTILLGVAAGVVAAAGYRAWMFSTIPVTNNLPDVGRTMSLYMGLLTRSDALLIGCLIGLLASWGLLAPLRAYRTHLRGIALGGVALVVFCAPNFHPLHLACYHGYFTLVALATAALIVCMLLAPLPDVKRVLEWEPLVGAGQISYGLYLAHIPIRHLLGATHAPGWNAPGLTLAVWTLTFAVALLSYYAVERPCLRLKDRLASSKGAAPVPPVARAA